MVYQSEKTLKDVDGKLDAADKSNLQTKIDALKEALKGTNSADIKAKMEDLQKAFYDISAKIYQQNPGAGQQAGPQEDPGMNQGQQSAGGDPNVVDADYKEVDDNK